MEGQKKPSIGIFIAVSILASVGVTLLLMASMGFLRTVYEKILPAWVCGVADVSG
jgi:hypothetical protein